MKNYDQIVRNFLLEFRLDTSEPVWSSKMIERMWDATLCVPEDDVSHVYKATYEFLEEFHVELSIMVMRWIDALTHNGRLRFFSSYEIYHNKNAFSWLLEKPVSWMSTVQLYILVQAIPFSLVDEQIFVKILRRLIATPVWHTSIGWAGHILNTDSGKQLLQNWLDEGVEFPYHQDLEFLLKIESDE